MQFGYLINIYNIIERGGKSGAAAKGQKTKPKYRTYDAAELNILIYRIIKCLDNSNIWVN